MEDNSNLEYRMYFLTPYNISAIQAGIQSLHGVVEYQQLYGEDIDYLTWAKHWKTVILLNGGTSNNTGSHMYENKINNPNDLPTYGTMEQHADALSFANIKYATFFEPDMNNMLTSIAFICDERVFKTYQRGTDDIYYPEFEEWLSKFKLLAMERDRSYLNIEADEALSRYIKKEGPVDDLISVDDYKSRGILKVHIFKDEFEAYDIYD